MKKFLAIIVVAILATSFAFSQHNLPVSANAQFDVKVILPLTWTPPADVDLGAVITGFEKPIVKSATFTLEGEALYGVEVTTHDPAVVDGVVLNGTWSGGGNATLGTDGKHLVVYTTSSVNATGATSNGEKTFTIGVEAKYAGL
ncbi:MAG: hypothetical protein M9949_11290 [Candidatus Kapabacteria bacterium]|nr:hypothetical protein [Candidatus Kapabacteria bacterium]